MSRCKHAVGLAGIALVLALCLFANIPAVVMSPWLGQVVQEILATLRDPGTQWMVFACCGVYFVTFNLLQQRVGGLRLWRLENADFWLTAALGFGALRYPPGFGLQSGLERQMSHFGMKCRVLVGV